MRLAVLGGSFNPVHKGHINIARSVYEELSYDRILFIPAFHNPHKKRISTVTDEQRVHMLHLALKGLSWADVDSCELERGGHTYTIQTIQYLKKKYEGELEGRIGFVIGDDLVKSFSLWKDPDLLAEEADLIVAHRLKKEKCPFPYRHTYLNNTLFTPSSTEVRDSVRNKRADSSLLVPESVADYIMRNRLYE